MDPKAALRFNRGRKPRPESPASNRSRSKKWETSIWLEYLCPLMRFSLRLPTTMNLAVRLFAVFAALPLFTGLPWADETTPHPMGLDGAHSPSHQELLDRIKQGNIHVVFFGDSSTFCWQTTGKDIWDKNIVPLGAADFGISGCNAQGLLSRMQNGELDGYQAKAVVIMIGLVNLLKGEPASTIAPIITRIVAEVRKRQPQAQIFLFNPPRPDTSNSLVAAVAAAQMGTKCLANVNELAQDLAKLDDGQWVHVIDMSAAMNARKMEMLEQLVTTRDQHKIHIEFEIWWNALKEPLVKIFGTGSAPLKHV